MITAGHVCKGFNEFLPMVRGLVSSISFDHLSNLTLQIEKTNFVYDIRGNEYAITKTIYFNPDKPDIETYLKHHFNAFINFCKTNNMFLVDEDLSALNPFFEGFLIRYTPVEGQFTKDITYRLEKLQALTTDLNTKYIISLIAKDDAGNISSNTLGFQTPPDPNIIQTSINFL